MNLKQLHFLKLAEECSEVAQECSKIIQFGLDEVYAPIGVSNADRLRRELQDLYAIVQILKEDFGFEFESKPEAVQAKREKIMKYAGYSATLGEIEPFVDPDECPAHDCGHKFEVDFVPSEFTTGVEGGPLTQVYQCVYCGKEK